jgi:hypothetical protein
MIKQKKDIFLSLERFWYVAWSTSQWLILFDEISLSWLYL